MKWSRNKYARLPQKKACTYIPSGGTSIDAVHPIIWTKKNSGSMYMHIGIKITRSNHVYLSPNNRNKPVLLWTSHLMLLRHC